MMQEDELVIKDTPNINVYTRGGREVQPFTISGMLSNLQNVEYHYSKFEVFVTIVVMMSTISGGFLEGYTSPAIPSLLINSSTLVSNNLSKIDMSNSIEVNVTTLNYEPLTTTSIGPTIYNLPEQNSSIFTTLAVNIPQNTTTDLPEAYLLSTLPIHDATENNEFDNSSVLTTEESISSTTILPQDKNSSILKTIKKQPESSINKTMSKRNVNVTEVTQPSLTKQSVNSTQVTSVQYEDGLKITEQEASWLGSLLLLGACFGAVISYWIVSLGRRHAILLSALPRLCGWLLIASSVSVSTLYAGRFLSGFSLGMVSTAAPIYISEISHPSLRGSFNCIVQLGVNIGIFLAALFGTFMGWQSLAGLGAVFVLFYFFPAISIPNSPSWLISTGKEHKAREVLKQLRGNSFSIEEELQQIITLSEKNKKNNGIGWKELFTERRTRMPLMVVTLVTLVNRFSGYNAIITYCATFLHGAVPIVSQYAAAAAVCFVQIIATGFSITVVDKWGRRKLLLLSIVLMGLSLVIIAICDGILYSSQGGAWLTVLSTMTFVGSYSLGVGPLTWVLLGELFPLDSRDKASSLVSILNWMSAFLVTKTYFNMETSIGVGGTCLVYAGVCLVGAICFYFLVPETKGRTLAEIEAHFSYSQVSWRNLVPSVDRAMSSILDQDVAATIDTYSTFH